MTKLTCPSKPHELDKHMRLGMQDIVDRVVLKACVEGRGKDLLLRVYSTGIYHGVELSEKLRDTVATTTEYNY